jgi:hypothetical protein
VYIEHIIVAALIAAGFALWVRRSTWCYLWERAGTFHVATIAAYSVFVMAPTTPLFEALHVTGVWNLEDLIGHMARLVGLGVLAYALLDRLALPHRRLFLRSRIELPAVLLLPVIVGAFIVGAPDAHVTSLVHAYSHSSLTVFWVTTDVARIWLLAHLAWALRTIRLDRDSRLVAGAYLWAVRINYVAAAVLIAAALGCPWRGLPDVGAGLLYGSYLVYVAAAVLGMRRRRSWLDQPPPRTTETA